MPIALAAIPVAEIADTLTLVGLGGGAIGGSIAGWCSHNPGHGCVSKRDVLDTTETIIERDDVGPCNVPMYNFDQCHQQVNAQTVQVTSSTPEDGVAQFDNVPPACMNLASALVGSCNGDGARPSPCGSSCLEYTGLNEEQLAGLSSALNYKKD